MSKHDELYIEKFQPRARGYFAQAIEVLDQAQQEFGVLGDNEAQSNLLEACKYLQDYDLKENKDERK
jgi:hypothetical protein